MLTYKQQQIRIKNLEKENRYLHLAFTEQRGELYDQADFSEFCEDKYNEKYHIVSTQH